METERPRPRDGDAANRTVAAHSFRLWKLKDLLVEFQAHNAIGCSSFVPIVETERLFVTKIAIVEMVVAAHSFRLWKLKDEKRAACAFRLSCCSSFVPIVETESDEARSEFLLEGWLQLIRSDCGN